MNSARSLLLLLVVASSFLVWAEQEFPHDLIARIKNNMSSPRDFSARLTVIKNMETLLKDQEQYYLFRKDSEGLLLLVQLKPEALKGRSFLLKYDELWLYNPFGKGFSQATPAQYISNSLACIFDISAFNFLHDYRIQKFSPDVVGDFDVHKIEFTAKQDSQSVPQLTLWITQADYLPLKVQYINNKGIPERTVYYHKYTRIDGEIYPVSIYIEHSVDSTKKTQLIFSQFNIQPIPDFVFTRAYLEEINKE